MSQSDPTASCTFALGACSSDRRGDQHIDEPDGQLVDVGPAGGSRRPRSHHGAIVPRSSRLSAASQAGVELGAQRNHRPRHAGALAAYIGGGRVLRLSACRRGLG
jgi:hypothetical protein